MMKWGGKSEEFPQCQLTQLKLGEQKIYLPIFLDWLVLSLK